MVAPSPSAKAFQKSCTSSVGRSPTFSAGSCSERTAGSCRTGRAKRRPELRPAARQNRIARSPACHPAPCARLPQRPSHVSTVWCSSTSRSRRQSGPRRRPSVWRAGRAGGRKTACRFGCCVCPRLSASQRLPRGFGSLPHHPGGPRSLRDVPACLVRVRSREFSPGRVSAQPHAANTEVAAKFNVCLPIAEDKRPQGSIRCARRNRFSSPVFGLRQSQPSPARCGQTAILRNRIPSPARSPSTFPCTTPKAPRGSSPFPTRPGW